MKGCSTILALLLIAYAGCAAAFSRPNEERAYKAKQDVRVIEASLNLFITDIGRCPTIYEGIAVLVEPNEELLQSGRYKSGGYVRKLPYDPWGNLYQYQCPGVNNPKSFDVWTLGSDGRLGGSGSAADIGNWPGAFEEMYARDRLEGILLGLAFLALAGFVAGLPLYVVGAIIKLRRGAPFSVAMTGFHLKALLCLVFIVPLVVGLLLLAIK